MTMKMTIILAVLEERQRVEELGQSANGANTDMPVEKFFDAQRIVESHPAYMDTKALQVRILCQ